MASRSSKPGPSGFKKRKYNPLCDLDEKSISAVLNVAPNFRAKQFTYCLCRHLKHLHVLAADISNNATTEKG
jgi:hypothetical protein